MARDHAPDRRHAAAGCQRGHRRRALEAELLADPKEAAEHLMLVDLGRNDLGRVCRPGTVEVVDFMKVQRYSHVMHLEAAVSGTLAPGRTALDATLSCFPAGTLSGAPKVRAMEIIDELEPTRRGLYGGVVGYVDFAGDLDTAIAIRTAVVATASPTSGRGRVVADSVPANEDAGSVSKAAAVLGAVAEAAGLSRLVADSLRFCRAFRFGGVGDVRAQQSIWGLVLFRSSTRLTLKERSMIESAERATSTAVREYHHGRTPAAWAGSIIAAVAFILGQSFMVGPNWTLLWVSSVLLVLSLVTGGVLRRMGFGQS